jgi:hypothetical protein
MFKRKGGVIEYYDSYGKKPEQQREWLTKEQLDSLGEGEPYLYNLLKASGYKVFYSTYPYQSDKDNINSCGRWVVARLMNKDLTNKEFYHFVFSDMKKLGLKTPDDWVAIYTSRYLGK